MVSSNYQVSLLRRSNLLFPFFVKKKRDSVAVKTADSDGESCTRACVSFEYKLNENDNAKRQRPERSH